MRRARLALVLALAVLPVAAWLVFLASGYGFLWGHEVHTSAAAEGVVICRYFHATGIYEVTQFTTEPDPVRCPAAMPIRWPARPPAVRPETQWAAAIPVDRRVEIECTFVQRPQDGSGLEQRYSAGSPLRLAVDLGGGGVNLVDNADRTALGPWEPAEPAFISSRIVWLAFTQGALPIFQSGRNGRLSFKVTPPDGRAVLMLNAANPSLLWVREGGCRPVT
jgi:hypothetical protein